MKGDNLFGLKLNREIFLQFSRLIREKSGVFFDLSKMYFLETRLKRRMWERGISDFISYYDLLKTDYSDREFKELLNEITIHETSFFRIRSQFQTFSDFVLPELIKAKVDSKNPYLSFLSAGCSTGEEAYSIAISVLEKIKFPSMSMDFNVLGIDISIDTIEKARAGLYGENNVSSLSEDVLVRYFERVDGNYKIKDFIKNRVLFKYANIYSDMDMSGIGGFDVVFCRYVLIYFDDSSKRKALANLKKVLNPGGYLFVAPSESYNVPDSF